MIIIYIDILLLAILLILLILTCGYCVYRVYSLQRSGQVTILLRPTKVLFSHKKEGEVNDQLRTVVAYQNPFTGDYCVHKSRGPKGYVNSIESPDSIDSGVSDAYEPLNLVPQPRAQEESGTQESIKAPISPVYDNSLNKTWKWDYTEYQI
ncbi:uncharacterized protein LOC123663598 [Melitaea cinxia]|uniref:uncharacterized protein LOC123663598 n=1 Tax=Melitaea cinxia TaxID=113334 RepID=UPI001E270693|nr:uncharacterized protein LOC123663598 [Melitaea cinxia]